MLMDASSLMADGSFVLPLFQQANFLYVFAVIQQDDELSG